MTAQDTEKGVAELRRMVSQFGLDVVEVPPQLSRRERTRTRRPGKSDPGDAFAIARVTVAEAGLPRLPVALGLWALALAFPVSRVGAVWLHNAVMRGLYWAGSAWMGLGFMLAFWLFAAFLAPLTEAELLARELEEQLGEPGDLPRAQRPDSRHGES